ncbi:unnamed protein product [Durusdinium trenchii]|uniref:Uncharacterized protein n=2 Tax=Durusdinium trenchii TaxID=1381693 RepID=A0ABP0QEE3_9DINO
MHNPLNLPCEFARSVLAAMLETATTRLEPSNRQREMLLRQVGQPQGLNGASAQVDVIMVQT